MLGRGAFGSVFEVVKRDCGKRYAMKILRKAHLVTAFEEVSRLFLVRMRPPQTCLLIRPPPDAMP